MLKSILVSLWRKILPSCFWTICTENPFNRLRSDVCLILRSLWCSVLLGHNGILAMNPHFVLVLSFALHQMLNLLQRGHKDDLGEKRQCTFVAVSDGKKQKNCCFPYHLLWIFLWQDVALETDQGPSWKERVCTNFLLQGCPAASQQVFNPTPVKSQSLNLA